MRRGGGLAHFREGVKAPEHALTEPRHLDVLWHVFKKAKRFAKDRREKIGAHRQGLKKYQPASQQKVTVGELLDALEADYRIRGRKSMPQTLSHLKPVRERFDALRAADVTGRLVDRYIDERLAAGDPNATINRRTQLLGQAYRREIEAGPGARDQHTASGSAAPSTSVVPRSIMIEQAAEGNTQIAPR
jgi:hypothetical protein